ncbi:MAG: T9SS C-terminal target domain-containing protein, partial [Bacteroidetes bacterium]
MKKTALLFGSIFMLFTGFKMYAQQATPFHPCGFNDIIDYYDKIQPGYKQQVDAVYQNLLQAQYKKTPAPAQTITLPVVVHVVYTDSSQNLPDSVIWDQILQLNACYQRLNADTINMRDTFKTIVGNPNIKFILANKDPQGNPTTGITRTFTTTDFGRNNSLFGPDLQTIEEVKSSATGGHDPWDTSKYINIWVCNMASSGDPSLLGYATPPPGLPNWPAGSTGDLKDGIVIQYQAFGRNNPNPLMMPDPQNPFGGTVQIDVDGKTPVHEMGHYLGLRHISGDPSPFGGNGCSVDDGVDDTPNTDAQSQFDCDTTKNTCVDNTFGSLGDMPDMIENFMDYSSELCENSFTQGQVAIMLDVVNNYRNTLLTSPGLDITGDVNGNGSIDNGEIAGDVNGDGTIGSGELEGDVNGNGVIDIDEVLGDTNGNGVLDPGEPMTVTGLAQIELQQVKIFPNPASDQLTIFTNVILDNITVSIYNEMGQLVKTASINNAMTNMDISQLPSGLYLVKIYNGATAANHRLI